MATVFGSESFERFLKSSWEIYVENYRLPVLCFSRIYILIYSWWKYRYPWWLLTISQCDWVGYFDVAVILCTMTWVGGGFPSTGYILPIRCLSTWSWFAFTDSHALISLLARRLIMMYFCHTSPLLLWTGSGVDFVGTSTLSRVVLQDCRIVWHLYSQ